MAIRTIVVEDTEWTVWETLPSGQRLAVAPGYESGWLTFESGGEKRRLRPIPAGWEEMAAEHLCLLLEQAERVRRSVSK